MTDARGIGPNTLRVVLDSLGLALVKISNTPDNIGKSPEMILTEQVSIKPRDYVARWKPDIPEEDWEEPVIGEDRLRAWLDAAAALDVPQCRRCRGTGYLLVGDLFKTNESCPKCDGSGRKNR